MSYIIGIDLGTSTTEAAIYRDGKPELILNFLQQPVTPSAVGIDENGNWIVGERARAQYLLYPEKTAIEVKRGIGTDHMFPIGKIFLENLWTGQSYPCLLTSMIFSAGRRSWPAMQQAFR